MSKNIPDAIASCTAGGIHFVIPKICAVKVRTIGPRLATLDTRTMPPPPKQVDPVLLTPEHEAWRTEVIGRANGYCQDPHCKTPNRKPSRLFADHIKERRDGGALFDPANGMARCGSCHSRKTAAERANRLRS